MHFFFNDFVNFESSNICLFKHYSFFHRFFVWLVVIQIVEYHICFRGSICLNLSSNSSLGIVMILGFFLFRLSCILNLLSFLWLYLLSILLLLPFFSYLDEFWDIRKATFRLDLVILLRLFKLFIVFHFFLNHLIGTFSFTFYHLIFMFLIKTPSVNIIVNQFFFGIFSVDLLIICLEES